MLDDQEIKRLLLRTAARDTDAFALLYRKTAPLLMGIALRIVGRRELAEEVLHDAFVKVWRSIDSFDPLGAQPVAWLAAIARNRAIDLIASADVARVSSYDDDAAALDRLFDWSAADTDAAGAALDGKRLAHWLRRCLDELRATERQALVLAYQHGLSHAELAAHLSKPVGTVKSWVRRGLASLRECVEHCAGGTP